MEFKPLASFELTESVARNFLDVKDFPKPKEGFPFKEFSITFPLSTLKSNSDSLKEFEDELKSIPTLRKKLESFLKENLTVLVKYNDDTIDLGVYDNRGALVEIEIGQDKEEHKVIKQRHGKEASMSIVLCALTIMQGTIWHYTSPMTIKQATEIRENRISSPIKGYNSPSKKYIYRTRYVFENAIRDITSEIREYHRKTESWMVKGHIRRYRDSDGNIIKETYIKPYKKGTGEVEKKEYKITRI